MVRSIFLLSVVALAGCSSSAPPADSKPTAQAKQESGHHDHAAMASGGSLMIETTPATLAAGKPFEMQLMIHDAAGKMIAKFDTIHTKQVHLIVVREGLDEFQHLHPTIDDQGSLTQQLTLPTAGNYWVYADHKPEGQSETTARGEIKVPGDTRPAKKLEPNVPGQVAGDSLSAEVEVVHQTGERPSAINFTLSDEAGKPAADLETYLGAMGHLVIISSDGQQYVHAHPNDADSKGNRVSFQTHFTKAGLYKGWGQFQRAGKVSTIPFVIRVSE